MVDSGEQAPKHQLHIDRRAAEDPEEYPGNAAQHWIGGHAHNRKYCTTDNADDHGQNGDGDGVEGGKCNALIKEVLEVGVPAKSLVAGGGDDEPHAEHDKQAGEYPAPRVA